jgi:predicted ester cyclase
MPEVTSIGELNKGKVRLFIEAVLNDGRLELIAELVAADYVGHISWGREKVLGPEGVRRLVAARRRAYPDLYVKIEDQLADEDRVATRWRAATTRCYSSGISIVRLLAGKQVDSYTELGQGISKP